LLNISRSAFTRPLTWLWSSASAQAANHRRSLQHHTPHHPFQSLLFFAITYTRRRTTLDSAEHAPRTMWRTYPHTEYMFTYRAPWFMRYARAGDKEMDDHTHTLSM
jgi:hypothetical protein